MLRLARWVAPVAAAAFSLSCSVASADDGVRHGWCTSKRFCVSASRGGTPGGESSGGAVKGRPAGATKGGKAPKCKVQRMDPQPPPGAFWDPGEGKVAYERTCPGGVTTHFAGAPGAAGPTIDPAVVAQQAVDKMDLGGPRIASPRAAGKYTVGVPMWMWVNPSVTTYGPNSASASAGGITVTATAEVSSIRWSMGDGGSVTCNGPGTKYRDSYGMSDSPTCGYRYKASSKERADGRWHGTATSTWSIHWEVTGGGGGEGDLTHQAPATPFTVHVGEMRVLD
ncbi:ATP/GTP-binding protein [Streptomyces aureus]